MTTQRIIKMDANENPLGCSQKVSGHIPNIRTHLYPEMYCPRLRKALADNYKVDPDEVFCSGAGSDTLIKVITHALVGQNEEVIIPEVAFGTYQIAANNSGGKPVMIPLKEHYIDLEKTIDSITAKTRLVWISNPHNPTGTVIKKPEFESVLERIPKNVFLAMDEAYIEMVEDQNCPNSLDYWKKYPNLIIIRTFSKAYGLASMRVGYGFARKELVEQFNKIIGCYDVNSYAQECAIKALEDSEFLEKVRSHYSVEKKVIYDALDSLGLKYLKTETNFIPIQLGDKSKLVVDELKKLGIHIKLGSHLGMEGWVRVSLGNSEDNQTFLEELRKLI